MKKYLKSFPEKCIGCHTCESVCSNLYFKENSSEKSSIKITETSAGQDINVCTQCGNCVAACPTLALTVNAHGVILLNKTLCIGCYMCVAACPTNSMMTYVGGKNPFKCVACGMCPKSCPTEAIKIVTE